MMSLVTTDDAMRLCGSTPVKRLSSSSLDVQQQLMPDAAPLLTPTRLRQPPLRVPRAETPPPPPSKASAAAAAEKPPPPASLDAATKTRPPSWDFDTKVAVARRAAVTPQKNKIVAAEASGRLPRPSAATSSSSPSTPRPDRSAAAAAASVPVNQMRGRVAAPKSTTPEGTFAMPAAKIGNHRSQKDTAMTQIERRLGDEQKLVLKLVEDLETEKSLRMTLETRLVDAVSEVKRLGEELSMEKKRLKMAMDMMTQVQRESILSSAMTSLVPSDDCAHDMDIADGDLASAMSGMSLHRFRNGDMHVVASAAEPGGR